MTLKTNLISHWKLDESSGTRADSHGANHLTDNNTVTSDTGLVYPLAAVFASANSEYLSIADNAAMSTGATSFSFAVFVYPTETTSFKFVLAKDAESNREYSMYLLAGVANFTVWVDGGTVPITAVSTAPALTLNTWSLVFGWHDLVAHTANVQINDGTADSVAVTGDQIPFSAGAAFRIGARAYVGSELFFDGRVGAVSFAKRVWTAGERAKLYRGGAGLKYSNFNPAKEDTPPASVFRRRR